MRRASAEIDLKALASNCSVFRRVVGSSVKLCSVVKANGYGHGAVQCAKQALAAGANSLAVVSADEAAELRASGIEAPILIMGALSSEELPTALQESAEVVAWHAEFIERLEQRSKEGSPIGVHIKLDTGMGRLGTRSVDEAFELVERVANSRFLKLTGVMTHFATADDQDDQEFFNLQIKRFTEFVERVKSQYPAVIAHAANSAATLSNKSAHFDMVRCGVGIYGLDPFGSNAAAMDLVPVMSLHSYVADVKPCLVGESVGYGQKFIAKTDTQIASVPIGYGDGVRRALSNNADVLIGSQRYPVVGNISMDTITVDVGSAAVKSGDRVTLIGSQGPALLTAEEMAKRISSINYEVTCGISSRVPRSY